MLLWRITDALPLAFGAVLFAVPLRTIARPAKRLWMREALGEDAEVLPRA